jgi:predicted MFS family arabinose efflux permease
MRLQIALFTLIKVLINTTYRMVYPFLSAFSGGLGVDLTAFSIVFTARSFTGILGPFLAPIADRQGRKTSMLLGMGVYVLGAGLVALWPSYLTFFAGIILTTLGNYIFLPAMQAYLGDRVPYERRGSVMAITETSWSLAFIVGVPLLGLLVGSAGWLSPFPILAVLGVLLTAALVLVVPATPPTRAANHPLWHSLGRALTYRPALAALALSFCITAANESVNLVFGVWLETAFGLKLAALALASAAIGLSELGGEGLSGLLVDRLGKPRAIRAGILLSALAALALPWVAGSQWGALVGLFFFYLTFEFTIVSCLPLFTEILPEGRTALMAANVAAFSLGRAAGSLLAPWLYQRLGFQANTVSALLFNLLALAALGFVRLPAAQSLQSDKI